MSTSDVLKHTPGPWEIDTEELIEGDERPIRTSDGAVVATAWPFGDDDHGVSEREANARLIAAAPELYEAIEECIGVLTEPGMMDVDEWKAWQRRAVIKARHARMKARGEDK